MQCEFSKLSDVELIFVIAVRKEAKEMIQIYQDKGIDGFKRLEQHEARLKVTIPPNFQSQLTPHKRFSLYESESGILRFISVYSEHGMGFVECIYT